MSYIQVDIFLSKKDPFAEIIMAELNEIDFESYQETDNGLQAYIHKDLYDKYLLKTAFKILENKIEFSFKTKEVEQQNWNAKWESSFQPIRINEKCVIRADFHKAVDVEYEIIITPKMSFGTGHHATTFLIVNQMFNLDFKKKSILDIGSGTGVLSILAEKLGANIIVGIDIDDWADKNAKENMILNSSEKIDFELGDISEIGSRKFDIILANINRNIILNDLHKYLEALNENGEILLSGFFKEDSYLILDEADKLSLQLEAEQSKENWQLLHFSK